MLSASLGKQVGAIKFTLVVYSQKKTSVFASTCGMSYIMVSR
jgi:hypothetical protein